MIKEVFKKYKLIKQHDFRDCAAACLSMICSHYGKNISISRMREYAGTDKNGTNAHGIIKASKSLGLEVKAVHSDQQSFFEEFTLPAIAHIITEDSLLHYVVIYKISKNKIIVADPAKGIIRFKPESFFKLWTGVLILLEPMDNFRDIAESGGAYLRFVKLIRPNIKLLLTIILISLFCTVLGIGGSFYFKIMIDYILPNNLVAILHRISIGVIIIMLLKILLNSIRTNLLWYLTRNLDISILLGYHNHIIDLPINFFTSRSIGEITSRFVDAAKIREAISGITLTIILDSIMAIAGGIVLYKQESIMFSIIFAAILIYGIIIYFFRKPIENVNKEHMDNNSKLTSYLIESLNGIETIKSSNTEHFVKNKTKEKFNRLLQTAFKGTCINNFQSTLVSLVSTLGSTIILWFGAYSVMKGSMTIGQLLTFNTLAIFFVEPVKNLINLQAVLQTAKVAADRLGEILELKIEQDNSYKNKGFITSLRENICFEDVKFRYGTREAILKKLSMDINKGEKIAIVGPSGSGKSTLAKLLMNFYSPEEGKISINYVDVKEIDLKTLRSKISYVSQDIFFFSGSVKENLTMGIENVSMESIVEIAKKVNAHKFISDLPLKYDTILEENGMNLSKGQRQRLAIARALLKNPDILILDEAASNLDSETEKIIENLIYEGIEGTTTISIAHRMNTIVRSDKIFVMDKGVIVESGTHNQLLNRKGVYYKLWKEQVGGLEKSGVAS